MSNRRRTLRPVISEYTAFDSTCQALAHAVTYRCPDCLSEVGPLTLTPGVVHREVAHDDTCPTWHRIRAAECRRAGGHR